MTSSSPEPPITASPAPAVPRKGGTLSYTNLDPVNHNVVASDRDSSGQPLFHSEFAALGVTVPVTGADKLAAGQYGVVLRPRTKSKRYAGADVAKDQGEGLAFNSIFSFAVK